MGAFFSTGLSSLLLTFWPQFRVRIWIEHRASTYTHRVHLNRFWRFLIAPHNLWVHYEHHEFVRVPFYNLEKCRERLGPVPRIVTLSDLFDHLAKTESQLISNEERRSA